MDASGTPTTSSASVRPHLVAIRPGALGDALLTFPLLAWLRDHIPGLRVTLVARSDVLALAQESGLANEVSPYDSPVWSAIFADEPPPQAGRAFEVCAGASVAAWVGGDDPQVRRNLLALGANNVAVSPGRPATSARTHMSLLLCEALGALGFPTPGSLDDLCGSLRPLSPSARSRATLDEWLRGSGHGQESLIAVHPGSGGAAKRWPAERFAALVDRLAADGYLPLLIEGPQDAEVIAATAHAIGAAETRTLVARGFSVEEMAALLARCSGFVGNDSGVAHLAALTGCPTVVIFGPTDPRLWLPIGRAVRAAHSTSGLVADVALETVLGSLHALQPG